MKTFNSSPSQVASDDPDAVDLMTNISEQLSSEKLTNQQQALLDDQLARQEALDRQFAEDGRKLDREMEDEKVEQGSAVDKQIDQQLKLVSYKGWEFREKLKEGKGGMGI